LRGSRTKNVTKESRERPASGGGKLKTKDAMDWAEKENLWGSSRRMVQRREFNERAEG